MSTEKSVVDHKPEITQQLQETAQDESLKMEIKQDEVAATDIVEDGEEPLPTSNEQLVNEVNKEETIQREDSNIQKRLPKVSPTQDDPTERNVDQLTLKEESVVEPDKNSTTASKISTEVNSIETTEPVTPNTEDDIFNPNKDFNYSSDELDEDDDSSSSDDDSSSEDSDSSDSSSDESDNESDCETVHRENVVVDEFNESDGDEGPIRSKNEVVDEKAADLPEGFTIGPDDPIEFIGTVTGLVERSVVIKGVTSAEYKVLKEGAILCFEDRTPLGALFEIFGQLHSPVYRVKFNNVEDFERFSDRKGQRVFYVVPKSEFVLTSAIKSIKGTDASAWNDEELAPEQQEFSDDEKEAASKSAKKKKRKNKNSNNNNDKKQKPNSQENQGQHKQLPNYMKARLTSLPTAGPTSLPTAIPTFNQPQQQYRPVQQALPTVGPQKYPSLPQQYPQPPGNAAVFQQMQQLLQLASQVQAQTRQPQFQQNQFSSGLPQQQYYQQPYYPQQQPYYPQQQQQQQQQYPNAYPNSQGYAYQAQDNRNNQAYNPNYEPQQNYSIDQTAGHPQVQQGSSNSNRAPEADDDDDGYDPSSL